MTVMTSSRPGPATVASAMLRSPKLCGPQTKVADLRVFFDDPHVHAALVVRDGVLISVVERDDLVGQKAEAPALECGSLRGRTLTADADLELTHREMLALGRRRLTVVDAGGRVLGLLCLKRHGRGFCSEQDVLERAAELGG